jgi:hypothetical protein
MVDFTDLLPQVYRYVTIDNADVVTALVTANLLGKDSLYPTGWVFTSDSEGKPARDIENSGKCAIVFSSYDSWSPQTRMHTSKFPRLSVHIYADVTRDAQGMPTKQDAEHKAKLVWKAISPLFHDAANRIHAFHDLPVISTIEGQAFSVFPVPNGDGAVRADVSYDLTLM